MTRWWFFVVVAMVVGGSVESAETNGAKQSLVLLVKEQAWAPSRKEFKLEIMRSGDLGSSRYDLIYTVEAKRISTKEITESEFSRIRDKFLGVILAQDARSSARGAAHMPVCQRVSYQIELPTLGERVSLCAGDYRSYFDAGAVVSELLSKVRESDRL